MKHHNPVMLIAIATIQERKKKEKKKRTITMFVSRGLEEQQMDG